MTHPLRIHALGLTLEPSGEGWRGLHPVSGCPTLSIYVDAVEPTETHGAYYTLTIEYGPVTVSSPEYEESVVDAYETARDVAHDWCPRLYRRLVQLEHEHEANEMNERAKRQLADEEVGL